MKRSRPELVVADAGPLIGLAIVGELRLLLGLFGNVLVPEGVAVELCLHGEMPGASALAAARDQGWLRIVPVADIPRRLLATVDRGEAEAIVLAKQLNVQLLIDERRGRIAAKSESVRIFGSGAVLIMAKRKRLIREVRPILNALTKANYRFSDDLCREILRLAGEV